MRSKILLFLLIGFSFTKAQTIFNFGWAHGFGSATDDYAFQTKLDAAGNIYVAGMITGTVDFDPGPGTTTLTANQHCYIAKYNTGGNLVWAKVMEDVGTSVGQALGIDATGNVYIGGYFTGTVDFDPGPGTATANAIGGQYLFFSKFDASGNFIWNNTMGTLSSQISPQNMHVTPLGDVIMTGSYNNTIDFDASIGGTYTLQSVGSSIDAFLMKYNTAGVFQWAFSIGDFNVDRGYGLDVDAGGNIFVTGHFQNTPDFDPSPSTVTLTSNGVEDIFLAKYSSAGNYMWASAMGGPGTDQGIRTKLNAAGEVLIIGNIQSLIWDADPSIATYTLAMVGTVKDMFLGKYNANTGALIWAKNTGGIGSVGAYNIATDPQNNIYLCGFFDGTSDFDFSVGGVVNLSPITISGADIFLAKYDNLGNYILAQNIGGGTGIGNEAYSINLNAANEIVLAGNFINTVDFDLTIGTYNQTSMGQKDFFISKYSQCIFPTITGLSSPGTVCAGSTITLSVLSGTLNGATDWNWYTGSCGGVALSTGTTVTTTAVANNTFYVKGEGGCIPGGGTCLTMTVTVMPLTNISGQVTTGTIAPVPVTGSVTLYRYETMFTKFDSITTQVLDANGNYTIVAAPSASYILQATPSATNIQRTYAGSSTSWKGATIFNHGCVTNLVQNVSAIALTTVVPGPGVLTGKLLEGLKYGQRGGQIVPGGPIKGALVKCGKNPGGDIVSQDRTSPTGAYVFSGLPLNGVGENYYIIVDIPGLDTNGTYHPILNAGNTSMNNLDFTADSAKINPAIFIGIKKISSKNAELNIYPNPTSGIINFEAEIFAPTEIEINVTDILGNEISKTLVINSNKTHQLNLTDINTGIYFMHIRIGNETKTSKIILAR